ncbi:hypothetical protein GE09DRAFT_408650 [Coniochaeta sp. 2T2.1]|nr:hypothetical protein GE09DRAFT_408650 [Coniochaeta sp. 2T2.1]
MGKWCYIFLSRLSAFLFFAFLFPLNSGFLGFYLWRSVVMVGRFPWRRTRGFNICFSFFSLFRLLASHMMMMGLLACCSTKFACDTSGNLVLAAELRLRVGWLASDRQTQTRRQTSNKTRFGQIPSRIRGRRRRLRLLTPTSTRVTKPTYQICQIVAVTCHCNHISYLMLQQICLRGIQ